MGSIRAADTERLGPACWRSRRGVGLSQPWGIALNIHVSPDHDRCHTQDYPATAITSSTQLHHSASYRTLKYP